MTPQTGGKVPARSRSRSPHQSFRSPTATVHPPGLAACLSQGVIIDVRQLPLPQIDGGAGGVRGGHGGSAVAGVNSPVPSRVHALRSPARAEWGNNRFSPSVGKRAGLPCRGKGRPKQGEAEARGVVRVGVSDGEVLCAEETLPKCRCRLIGLRGARTCCSGWCCATVLATGDMAEARTGLGCKFEPVPVTREAGSGSGGDTCNSI